MKANDIKQIFQAVETILKVGKALKNEASKMNQYNDLLNQWKRLSNGTIEEKRKAKESKTLMNTIHDELKETILPLETNLKKGLSMVLIELHNELERYGISNIENLFIENEITKTNLTTAVKQYRQFQTDYSQYFKLENFTIDTGIQQTELIELFDVVDSVLTYFFNLSIESYPLNETPLQNQFKNLFSTEYKNELKAVKIKRKEARQKMLDFLDGKETETETEEQHSQFSVTEWATIFYYAEYVKALEGKTMTNKIESFMNQYGIGTTQDNFRNTFYDARKRINVELDYPINKLKLILPFIKEHYPHAKELLQSDIEHLEDERNRNEN